MVSRLYYAVAIMSLLASPAQAAGGKSNVGAALDAWVKAVEGGSAEKIAALYDKDAIMISTFVQAPITSHQELLDYYQKVVVNPDVDVTVEEAHPRLFGDMAVNTGRYTLSYTQDGEPVSIPARFSFVYQWHGGRWIIVDHHSSRMPMAEETDAQDGTSDE